jgi:hypothetical protein
MPVRPPEHGFRALNSPSRVQDTERNEKTQMVRNPSKEHQNSWSIGVVENESNTGPRVVKSLRRGSQWLLQLSPASMYSGPCGRPVGL